jgi:hypothetical protein
MPQHALYVVSDLGRDRFIWAASAAEAREKVSAPPARMPFERPRPSVIHGRYGADDEHHAFDRVGLLRGSEG